MLSEKYTTVVSTNNLVAQQILSSNVSPVHQGVATAQYNFVQDGGAQHTYELVLSKSLPKNAAVTSVIFVPSESNPLYSTGLAAISLGINAPGDVLPETPITDAPLDALTVAPANIRVAANALKTVIMTINVADLSSGEITFKFPYVLAE